MKSYLLLSGIIACITFGVLGTVFLLMTGWGILALPFWLAAWMKGAFALGEAGDF